MGLFSGKTKLADKSDASVECVAISMLGRVRHACYATQRPNRESLAQLLPHASCLSSKTLLPAFIFSVLMVMHKVCHGEPRTKICLSSIAQLTDCCKIWCTDRVCAACRIQRAQSRIRMLDGVCPLFFSLAFVLVIAPAQPGIAKHETVMSSIMLTWHLLSRSADSCVS